MFGRRTAAFAFYWLVLGVVAACNLQQAVTPSPPTATPIATPITALPAAPENQDTALCYFTPFGIGAPFDALETPTRDVAQRVSVGMVDYGVYYPLISYTETWYQIVVSEGLIGWVAFGTGELVGNCEDVLFTPDRPPAPEGVCTVYFDTLSEQDVLYVDQRGGEVVAPMVAGEYLVVEARGSSGGLRVRLSDGRTGWLTTPDQVLYLTRALNGECEALPVEVSLTPGG